MLIDEIEKAADAEPDVCVQIKYRIMAHDLRTLLHSIDTQMSIMFYREQNGKWPNDNEGKQGS